MEFTKQDNTYFADATDTLKIEIGDAKQPAVFYPQIKLLAFENEANFSARLITAATGTETKTAEEKIQWNNGKIGAEIFNLEKSEQHPQGALEFNVILKEKPALNNIDFSLQFKDAEFIRQPPLTECIGIDGIVTATETEGKDAGGNIIHRRPENVVNSYAVYLATPRTNETDGKKYRTGKIAHIYRPIITDSNGKACYGELKISADKTTLSIIIPQDFLDAAIYPVFIDPTFGYTTAGASSAALSFSVADVGATTILSLGATENNKRVTAIYAYGSGGDCSGAIYDLPSGAGTAPNTRYGSASLIDLPASAGWNSVAVAIEILAGKDYCVATGIYNTATLYYDAGSGNERSAASANTLPTTWTHSNYSANKYSQYAEYTTINRNRILLVME